MPVFEVVIVLKATEKEIKDGKPKETLLYQKTLIAKDETTAGMHAIRGEGVPPDLDLDRADVMIRPFA